MARDTASEPIAIVGSGCRFPGGCSSPSQLWELLRKPHDLRKTIPENRFSAEGFYHVDGSHHGTSNIRQGYFLDQNVRHFDASFFNIRPNEANAIDPQQRLLLEVVYESLESAGLDMHNLQGSDTAVYVGLMCGDYEHMLMRDFDTIPMYHATGNSRSIISNRISYFFDWTGPSMTIDTACSSSLIAIHQAVQVLRSGDSRMAIAAGSNLLLGPEHFIGESKLKMLSPSGRSQMWDAGADGYARGEGVGAVVLKTLSSALEDGDHIECIIRETGINQDGRTNGLTMPSATAQAALIRSTYRKAGLDPKQQSDRPQYFEAHGTGTPAGDPLEAEAIHNAFFADSKTHGESDVDSDRLWVGSVKTVIGHTEGTAGIAGVLKVSLALQNAQIPPNLHFRKLNPTVEPYYGKLEIPTRVRAWPENAMASVRRASVNCFGFGGANSHAILESYNPAIHNRRVVKSRSAQTIPQHPRESSYTRSRPFIFSANSTFSLRQILESYLSYLQHKPKIDLDSLAATLQTKRCDLRYRTCVVAADWSQLCTRLEATLAELDTVTTASAQTVRNKLPSRRLLGIFTGQGAQWAEMGRSLILESAQTRQRFMKLEASLDDLPQAERPTWSLLEELLRPAASSRINQAELSQPLCTAVQIVLVDLLKDLGIKCCAVVGHSSGEIAAAYAAGSLSSSDALKIAYLRGFHSHLSQGSDGQPGAMLAAGTDFTDAQQLCELPFFDGRIAVAACNSSSSTTLSGDEDAVLHAKLVLEDEAKFARRLVVTKAYHSHHMLPCSSSYQQSISDFQMCQDRNRHEECTWFSSVYPDMKAEDLEQLSSTYWVDNMTRPVLFFDALVNALKQESAFDAVIEIGPHPTLKGPVLQTVRELYGREIPYFAPLKRGSDAFESMAVVIGEIWKQFGKTFVSWSDWYTSMNPKEAPLHMQNLPPYSWDHEREFWHESRISAKFRTRPISHHILLGQILPQSTREHVQWRNILKPKEIPWLSGHRLQGQMVFPAAGYIVTAIEAGLQMTEGKIATSTTMSEFVIGQALVFDNEDSAVEILFSCTNIRRDDNGSFSFDFTFSSADWNASTDLSTMARGHMCIDTNEPAFLAEQSPIQGNLVAVDDDRFYTSLEDLGYGYSGHFRALSQLQRRLGFACGVVKEPPRVLTDDLIVHPAMLDATIQSLILAYSYPRDGRLWALHVPVSIDRLTVDFSGFQKSHSISGRQLRFNAHIHEDDRSGGIQGDVNLLCAYSQPAILQIEGLQCVPFSAATEAEDTHIFSKTEWHLLEPACYGPDFYQRATAEDHELASILERVSLFYIRRLDDTIPRDHPARLSGAYALLFNWISHTLSCVRKGRQQHCDTTWNNDSLEDITNASSKYAERIDLKVAHVVGQQMWRVILGQTTILEHLMRDGLLTEYYRSAMGLELRSKQLCTIVSQLAQRYPKKLRILEVGAGTGSTTRNVLSEIGHNFLSYTYTDISASFFDAADSEFRDYEHKMSYKAFDLETDPISQGFSIHSYDVVIATMVLHATSSLATTLRNVRQLLRPGGYLIFLEGTNISLIRGGHIFGSLPGWWVGAADGRVLSPGITTVEWDKILSATGFDGAKIVTPDLDPFPFPLSVVAAQAIDDQVVLLREPLQKQVIPILNTTNLFILMPATMDRDLLYNDIPELLKPYYAATRTLRWPDDIIPGAIPDAATILSLCDLEQPCFSDLDRPRFNALKTVFGAEAKVLWVSSGCKAQNPFANMALGFIRCQQWENHGLVTQFLDIEPGEAIDAEFLAGALLKFDIATNMDKRTREERLFSIEPELSFRNGFYQIPRLVADVDQNLRFNATRRNITQSVDPGCSSVAINLHDSRYTLERSGNLAAASNRDLLLLRTMYTGIIPIRCLQQEPLYLVAGTSTNSGRHMLGLSGRIASIIDMRHESMVECAAEVAAQASLIPTLMDIMAIMTLARFVQPYTSIILHEPSKQMLEKARILLKHSSVEVINVQADSQDKTAVFINQHTTVKAISSKLGTKHGILVACSHTAQAEATAKRIALTLPQKCLRLTMYDDIAGFVGLFQLDSIEPIQTLKKALAYTLQVLPAVPATSFSVVPVSDLPEKSPKLLDSQTVIDWNSSAAIMTAVRPADTLVVFDSQSTYWLIGLVNDIGSSLCEWMVSRGARYLVLSSRSAHVDEDLVLRLTKLGTIIKYVKCDISSHESVRVAYNSIISQLPPIRGVAHGAMVLEDSLTRNMTFEAMQRVLQPKVQGSIYLDELFNTQQLDFFILFSSMVSVVGNAGQANYAAANMFMTSLANQRRQRGVAASIINLGAILGAGYITRQQNISLESELHRFGISYLSMKAVLQIFAEAVIAGHPRSNHSGEISTALRYIPEDDLDKPLWTENPRFAYQIIPKSSDSALGTVKQFSPIQQQLEVAANLEDAKNIIKEHFILKLNTLMQMNLVVSDPKAGETRTDSMGIDSLMAVEIRAWFSNYLGVNMPVLKILSGSSIDELAEYAVANLPERSSVQVETEAPVESSSQLPNHQSDNSSTLVAPDKTSSTSRSDSPTSPAESSEDYNTPYTNGSSVHTQAKVHPLSASQSLYYFIHTYLDDKTTLNHTGLLRIGGQLDTNKLSRAVTLVAQRHDALSTRFLLEDASQPRQQVMEQSTISLETLSIVDEADALREYEQMKHHVFDLSRGEIMRIILLSSAASSYLVLGCHHINLDFVSLQLYIKDLDLAYTNGKISNDALQYLDYTEQYSGKGDPKHSIDLEWWTSKFQSLPKPLTLPSMAKTKLRTPLETYATHDFTEVIDARISGDIRRLCKQHGCTPFQFYLAVFQIVLLRVWDVDDICVGIADSNRRDEREMDCIGPLMNLLPLRFKLESQQSFSQVLKATRREVLSALSHNRIAFHELLDHLRVPRSADHSPLFQVFVDYRQAESEKRAFEGRSTSLLKYQLGRAAYDISLDIVDDGSQHHLTIMLQQQIFDAEAGPVILSSFANLISVFTEHDTWTLDRPSLFKDEDLRNIITVSNGPKHNLTWPDTIIHQVITMCDSSANKVALQDHRQTLTYSQMHKIICSIGRTLHACGIERGSPVIVCQEPSVLLICSALAVMAIGAIFVPVDITTRQIQITRIVNDCKPDLILVDAHSGGKFNHDSITAARVDVTQVGIERNDTLAITCTSTDFAAILYTSGSTGEPKGVILTHDNIRNELAGSQLAYGFSREVVLQQSAIGFDMALTQIFTAVAFGGTLVIAPLSFRGDAHAITALIKQSAVTFTGATPSEYMSWIRYGEELTTSAWRIAVSGGEHLPKELIQQLAATGLVNNLQFFNAYGPTEATCSVTKTASLLGSTISEITVGKPSANSQVYICDRNLQLLPLGMSGEIVIGGRSVAHGYVNDISKDRFVTNTIQASALHAERLYRTGDYGKWLPDGNLIVEGRIDGDTQVKIRGQRFDVRQVEAYIMSSGSDICQAVIVLPRQLDNASEQILVAYVVLQPGIAVLDAKSMLSQLKTQLDLPQHMLPSVFQTIEAVPTTQAGKTDRRAMAEMPLDLEVERSPCDDVLTRQEMQVHELWSKVVPSIVLDRYSINSGTDFFHVGGNSIALVALQAQIRQTFGMTIPLVDLFGHSTLSRMTYRINSDLAHKSREIDWSAETEPTGVDLASYSPRPMNKTENDGLYVVLTGATGFVGRALVSRLLQESRLRRLYCIAVRNKEKSERLPDDPRVEVYHGDLGDSSLGLSATDIDHIFTTANIVVHNGTDVSHLKSYHTLKPANVNSTMQLIKLCLPRRIPIHYISTAGVMFYNKNDEVGEETAALFSPPVDGSDGYTATKWASEICLEKAALRSGMPVVIHRPSSIIRQDDNSMDIMQNLLRYSRILKKVPNSQNLQGVLDLVKLNSVTELLTRKVLKEPQDTGVQYVNMTSDEVISLATFAEYLSTRDGFTYNKIPLREWTADATQAGMAPALAAFFSSIDEGQSVLFPRFRRHDNNA